MTVEESTRKKTVTVKLADEVNGDESRWRTSEDGERTAVT